MLDSWWLCWRCGVGVSIRAFPLPSLLSTPGEASWTTVLSHPSPDAQTNCWATVGLYRGQDFLEFPRLSSYQKTRPATRQPHPFSIAI